MNTLNDLELEQITAAGDTTTNSTARSSSRRRST